MDLRNDPTTLQQLAVKNQRPITQAQGECLARMCAAQVYLECSSMLNFNVRNVFEQAIESHIAFEERNRHSLSHGRRLLSNKLPSCSWLGSFLCCTRSANKKATQTERKYR